MCIMCTLCVQYCTNFVFSDFTYNGQMVSPPGMEERKGRRSHQGEVIYIYCTVLYCTVLYYTVLYCTILYCTVLYCTVLYFTLLYCNELYYTVLYRTELYTSNKGLECCVCINQVQPHALSP